ncbi:MAG: ChaN family lipoprotein, partial [Chitinophagaceae bacterium]|nr:ChaN family lipoprotein [Chitinophagaceae bacterium]
DHSGPRAMNFVAAQAIKDATMAESILENLKRKQLMLHFEGDYHSKEYGGIYWYLKEKKKRLKIAVVSVFESDDLSLPLPEGAVLT